jgi:integrase/recombinase XerC
VREDILNFRDELKNTGHSPATIQTYITVVKLFFRWTSQEKLYPNIADHIKGAKIGREHKKDYLTADQVREVLSSVEQNTMQGMRDYAILVLMLTCGLRTIEVSRANIGDLRVLGDNTVLYIQGKGREGKSEYVKVPKRVEKAIRSYLMMRGYTHDTDPLFVSTSNTSKGARLTTRSISGIVKQALKNAGYNSSRLTAHSLRHTAVTLALLAGVDLAEVQNFARHKNITTTMIYNHAIEDEKNRCSNAVAETIFREA